jgi:3-oxoacyl-[acyl-carrier-protein] synthase-3
LLQLSQPHIMPEVYIIKSSTYLPNEPVENECIEQYLGFVNNKTSKAKSIVLRNNGIKLRYYAYKNGMSTHTNAELTAESIKKLFISEDICMDILTCGTSSPDQLLPSHAAMTLGVLNTKPTEMISPAGACSTSIQGLKYAYLALKNGDANTAVCTGSEKFSTHLLASKFNGEFGNIDQLEQNGYLAFEKDFLRYMLSDGASAVLVSNTPNSSGLSLKIDWIEIKSYSNEVATCMYMGAEKDEAGNIISWKDMEPDTWVRTSVFTTKQDTRLLGDNIVAKGVTFLEELIAKRDIDLASYTYFLPHLSSEFFRSQIFNALAAKNLSLPLKIWFTNLHKIGNIGSASPFAMLDELFTSKPLKKGDKILMMIPESSRFIYSYVQLTVV